MDAELTTGPEPLLAGPDRVVRTGVRVANVSEAIDQYTFEVYGVDAAWVTTDPPLELGLPLFPDEVGEATVEIALPEGFPAGERQLTIKVQSANSPREVELLDVTVRVEARPRVTLAVEPSLITSGSKAVFTLVAVNEGNVAAEVSPEVTDPEALSTFDYEPKVLHVPPGRRQGVEITVRSRRPWLGSPKPKLLTFEAGVTSLVHPGTAGADPAEGSPTPTAVATFVQRPWISRLLVSLLGLALVAVAFGAVINKVVNDLIKKTAISFAVLDKALASGTTKGAQIPNDPYVLRGQLLASTTGQGIGGVTAELFRQDNPTVVVTSAATADDGRYVFVGLEDTQYYLRFSGAGFVGAWWPGVDSLADAEPLTPVRASAEQQPPPASATPGGSRAGQVASQAGPDRTAPLALVGSPGVIRGRITSASPSGATVSLLRPSVTPPAAGAPATTGDALVAETDVSVDGSFVLDDLPSPATYLLVVRRPGSAVERREVRLDPGGDEEVEISLRDADGIIQGQVVSGATALGGAVVTASDGLTEVGTVSLTEGAERGSFTIRGLSVPGTYTLTTTLAGYSTETRSVTLVEPPSDATSGFRQPGQPFRVELTPTTGTVTGSVSVAGFGPVGGITVTVAAGQVKVASTTVSQGNASGAVGSFVIEALPAPATYTVTFSAPGLVSQTVQVELDPARGLPGTPVSVALVPATGRVRGVVVDADNRPVAGAELELNDGTDARKLVSADDPAGGFEFAGIAPGTYVLSAVLPPATAPTVVLVNLRAGEVWDRPVRLERQASLSGRVLRADGTSFAGATVRIYRAADYEPPPEDLLRAPAQITGPDGSYVFPNVKAPEVFVVAAFLGPTDGSAFATQVVITQPSVNVPVPDLVEPPR